jgi:hypothetical protein
MKKGIVIVLMTLFLASCGQSFVKSEFTQHDAMYKNWDHMKFSWFGHNNPTDAEVKQAAEEGWWGIEVPYIPGQ